MIEFTEPSLTENINRYSFEWEKDGLLIDVDRGKEHDAELWLYHLNGDKKYALLDAFELNLMGARSEDSFVKRLNNKDKEYNWKQIFTYVSAKSLQLMRRGEPLQQLGRKPETMKTEYVLWPIIERNTLTTIYGPGGTAKSYVAIGIAVSVQFNISVFDIHPDWLPTQGNVLYLDWESDQRTHEKRVWAIKKGCGLTHEDTMDYLFCDYPLIQMIDQIRRHVIERNISLVIVDSQMAAQGSGMDPNVVATQMSNAARSLRCSVLIIDHVNKTDWRGGANDNSFSAPIGAVAKYNRVRAAFEFTKSQTAGEDFIELSIKHTKNNDGKLIKPIGMRIDFNENGGELESVQFKSCKLEDNADLAPSLNKVDRIAYALKKGGKTKEELIAELGFSDSSMKGLLNNSKLKGQKRFYNNNGVWFLTDVNSQGDMF